MRMAIIGFVAGAALLQTQPALPPLWTLALAPLPLLAAWAMRRVVRAPVSSTAPSLPVSGGTSGVMEGPGASGAAAMASGVTASSVTAFGVTASGGAVLAVLASGLADALAGAALGFLWAAWLAHCALAPELARADEGRDFDVVGTVDSLPFRFQGGVRFNFAVEGTSAAPPLIALSWYSGMRGGTGPVPEVQPGERWRLKVRLQRPHGNANPYGFDYEIWLLEQGIRATGYVRAEGPNERLSGFEFSLHNAVERTRAALRSKIMRTLEGKPYAGVIVALAIGDQRGIPQSDWQVFNRTGISHLISISGLHITMVAGLVALLATWLWRHSFFVRGAALPLMLPAQKLGAVVGMLAALGYVALAGFGVPAQRTLYMLSVVAVAVWCDRLTSISHVLLLAAGVTVLLDPWAVMWPGFWLSFGAVATILYASIGRPERHSAKRPERSDSRATSTASGEGSGDGDGGEDGPGGQGGHVTRDPPAKRGVPFTRREKMMRELSAAATTQYAVTVGLVPLTMLLFSQISIISPIANAFAIPLVSLLVTPLALAGCAMPAPLDAPLLLVAHELVNWLAAALTWCSARPFAIWSAPTPDWWMFAFALAGTAWLLAPRGWPTRWLGIATWLPLLAAEPAHPPQGELLVTAFDVGQGMALLIETGHHRLLYDTGPYYAPEANGGNRVIVPYLKARGINRLDGIIVTHSDADHSGGALTVMESVRTGWLLSSLSEGHPIVKAAPHHSHCEAGQHWEWDGVRFDMLHPMPDSYADRSLKPNARGCTLMIRGARHAILLPADIEAAQEAALVAREGDSLRADVLLVPHHGSGTSSTPVFLNAVKPQQAIFQLGYRNRYHHPRADVVERYRQLGATLNRTDESGAIILQLGQTLTVTKYREQHARYWYGR
ncbi:DNA internalization-related competence protein ComEC/Rec2 [Pseudoduganella sp. RAF19]|uniref:DNA internalization-related competence protein ComEC/Rec2 n=1 Tax=Pseudoduganella sp. RAF19 TaxID=3233052 RepID=UPI003F9B3082